LILTSARTDLTRLKPSLKDFLLRSIAEIQSQSSSQKNFLLQLLMRND
jgi:hypothetical protein